MHSSDELKSGMFQIEIGSRRVSSFAGLCEGFTALDRLGVVSRHTLGALRNTNLMLAAVTAFYDEQRGKGRGFFIYPDYFIFHQDCPPGNFTMCDIWPEHKCLQVEGSAERTLQAINDRGVTLLVVRQGPQREDKIEVHTRNSALSRIRHAFLSLADQEASPTDCSPITVQGNSIVDSYVRLSIDRTENISDQERAHLRGQFLPAEGEAPRIEKYIEIPVESALSFL